MSRPSELASSFCNEYFSNEDLRLTDPQKHWLQLTGYDLDKIKRIYDLRVSLPSKAGDSPDPSNPAKVYE